MGISKEEAVKALQTRDKVYVAYAQATKLPYVTCDEETFNDQAWIFATEEEIKEFGKKCLEDKILLLGMRTEGEEKIEVELSDVAKQADMSKIEENKRPLFNPALQLSGIYFMQELRRPVKKEERKNMREMEEEVLANIVKSSFLVAMAADENDPKKVNIPYLKTKDEKILQPVFTDVMEFEKFAKGKKMRVAKVPFAKLLDLMIEQAHAYVINPQGFNLVLDREQLKRIAGVINK